MTRTKRNVRGRCSVRQWISGMVGVRPSGRFARKDVASTLLRLSAEIGRKRNFKRGVTKCSGYCSQTATRKAGFLECERLAYRDFRFGGQAVFAGIEPR